MTGLGDLEETIARLEAAAADGRAVTSELHSAIKAARGAERDLDAAVKRCREEIVAGVDEAMADAMAGGLEAWGKASQEAMAKSVERVQKVFDQHANLCIYGNTQGRGVSIFDEVRSRLERARHDLTDVDPRLPVLREGSEP